MNDKPAIEVANISKSYTISHQHRAHYGSLRDSLTTFFERPFLRKNQTAAADMTQENFWALKGVSFDVNKGEIFGVLGKNGSGKSTLLKILSRIVEPNSGSVTMRGRVASLLEVGTGFHPELTGRENVFFNGSMLGMSRDEIGQKFDEIVQFAEIEKFLDTPIKFYSSGMYVRLAFSVAAHLEPDILILDEVLAVGDAGFQQKSLNKIMSTMEDNRTVLIVSHSMDTIKSICTRGILLSDGEVKSIGPIRKVIRDYSGILPTLKPPKTKKLEGVTIISATQLDSNDKKLTADSPFGAELRFVTARDLPNCYINAHIEDSRGTVIIHSRTDFVGDNPSFSEGHHTATVTFDRLSLNPGTYSLWFRLYAKIDDETHMADSDRIMFEVRGDVSESMSAITIPSHWQWSDTSVKKHES